MITFDSGSSNSLLNLIKEQDDIDKIYLYVKDLSELKYEFFIKKGENVGIDHFNDPNISIECSNTMDDFYENIDDYNPSRKRKILIVFNDMIADIMSNKRFEAIVKDLFIRCRTFLKIISMLLSLSLFFLSQKMWD